MKHFLFVFCVLNSVYLSSQDPTVGLIQYESDTYEGFTLFAPGASINTYLIDNCGKIINEWQATKDPGLAVYLLEDGSILRTAENPQSGIFTGGLGGLYEKYSWNGELLWSWEFAGFGFQGHHDIEPLANGNILILAYEVLSITEAMAAGRNPALLDGEGLYLEQILEIEPVGTSDANIVWRWHLKDHIIQDLYSSEDNFGVVKAHPELIDINHTNQDKADIFHFNSIDYNPTTKQILLSSKETSEIYVIEHSESTDIAAGHDGGLYNKGGDILYRYGNPSKYNRFGMRRFYGQHNAHWIEEGVDLGKILVYNNGVGRVGEFSSVDIIDPPIDSNGIYSISADASYGPENLFWSYADQSVSDPFYSPIVSGAQRLPNGNTLICIGDIGRFIEINPSKEIVWEYRNPVSFNVQVQGAPAGDNLSFRAEKYAYDFSGFIGKDLAPGPPIERNPNSYSCVTTGLNEIDILAFSVVPNPTSNWLEISLDGLVDQVRIINLQGQEVLYSSRKRINISNLLPGCYFVQVKQENKLGIRTLFKID